MFSVGCVRFRSSACVESFWLTFAAEKAAGEGREAEEAEEAEEAKEVEEVEEKGTLVLMVAWRGLASFRSWRIAAWRAGRWPLLFLRFELVFSFIFTGNTSMG